MLGVTLAKVEVSTRSPHPGSASVEVKNGGTSFIGSMVEGCKEEQGNKAVARE